MNETLHVYTNPRSRGAIARWMLEETGAGYDTTVLHYGTTMKAPEFLAINPLGKVPAIRHGDQVVTECAAICAFLADAFPEAGLAPPPHRRGAYYRWLFFAAGPLEAAVINRTLGFEVPAERDRFVGYGPLETLLDTLEAALSAAPFLAGERFSAADVYAGSQIGWGMNRGTIEARPGFRDYWDRITSRPAHARARALDAEAMPPPGPWAAGTPTRTPGRSTPCPND